jgi:hypothetical protein
MNTVHRIVEHLVHRIGKGLCVLRWQRVSRSSFNTGDIWYCAQSARLAAFTLQRTHLLRDSARRR